MAGVPYTARSPRLGVINLDRHDSAPPAGEPEPVTTIWAQFNPTELELGLKAVYTNHVIPGMSHTPRQFSHTENMTFGFDLYYCVNDPLEAGTRFPRFTLDEREEVERFFLSLVVPRGETLITRNCPPPVLIIWPRFISFKCTVNEVKMKYTQFNRFGEPTELTVSLQVEELRDVRYSSKQAFEMGLDRARSARLTGE